MSKAKACGNYMLFQMARTEAKRDGYDEAILLDANGHVAEGSVEHIFLVRDGALVTPPLTHLLDGDHPGRGHSDPRERKMLKCERSCSPGTTC